jgi:hypothetical protein
MRTYICKKATTTNQPTDRHLLTINNSSCWVLATYSLNYLYLQTLSLDLPQFRCALVHTTIDGRGNGQCTSNDSAKASEETSESFGTFFAVDDFHWGDVLF